MKFKLAIDYDSDAETEKLNPLGLKHLFSMEVTLSLFHFTLVFKLLTFTQVPLQPSCADS